MKRIVTRIKLDMLSHCLHAEMVSMRGERLVDIADAGIAHELLCQRRISEVKRAERQPWLEGRGASLRSSL